MDKSRVIVVIETASLMVEDAIEGIKLHKFDIVGAFAPGLFEDFIEHKGGGDHGWPGIELETVDLVNISPATGFIALFEDFDFVTARRQTGSRPQAPKTTTNNDYFFLHVGTSFIFSNHFPGGR